MEGRRSPVTSPLSFHRSTDLLQRGAKRFVVFLRNVEQLVDQLTLLPRELPKSHGSRCRTFGPDGEIQIAWPHVQGRRKSVGVLGRHLLRDAFLEVRDGVGMHARELPEPLLR